MSDVIQVAVPVPLLQLFDYLPPVDVLARDVAVGVRVAVPFGRGSRVGIVVDVLGQSSVPAARLKRATRLLDTEPLIHGELLATLRWVARYYQHPLGEVLDTALPAGLRRARALPEGGEPALTLTDAGKQMSARKGSGSARLLELLALGSQRYAALDESLPQWRRAAAHLRRRGAIAIQRVAEIATPTVCIDPPPLSAEQRAAISAIGSTLGQFVAFLLQGITGSGKTEVYLALANEVLRRGRQVLILVPEIGLTPQLLRRVRERTGGRIHVLHSNLPEGERMRAWLAAARGDGGVFVGTRSAIFAPLPRAGLIVVDEEHDASYKQQDGLRYSARDLALVRGKALDVPVVLGSATPSLESLANVEAGRYRLLQLGSRPGAARVPEFRLIDLRGKPLVDGMAPELLAAIRECLGRGEQALLFRNRRGYAPVLFCHGCGWLAACTRCDKPLTWHRGDARLRCHHCGAHQAVPAACPQCAGTALAPRGVGTERMEQALKRLFPATPVVRIDRETTRDRRAFESLLARIPSDRPGIFVGTQMLAKGHDLPNLTLVGLIGVDDGLFSIDFRASERLSQLVVQVAGRAGRALKPGRVWLQTHHPGHPLLRELLRHGYMPVAAQLLEERRGAGLPPYAHLAVLRAEAKTAAHAERFLDDALREASTPDGIDLAGPMPAPMPRRAGFDRRQLLLSAEDRARLHAFLTPWLARVRALDAARKVRWSIDVDPIDLY